MFHTVAASQAVDILKKIVAHMRTAPSGGGVTLDLSPLWLTLSSVSTIVDSCSRSGRPLSFALGSRI